MVYRDEDYVDKWANGTITDISMLGKMENLSEVYLYNQNITNIDVLEGLPIRKLYLSGNKIEDFRVLEKLPQLEELGITKNPIRYLPDFSKCRKLKSLIMNKNTVTDLNSLRNSSVEQMTIQKLHVVKGDYTFLEEMPELTRLLVWHLDSAEIVEEITHLTNIKNLEVNNYRRTNLDFLASLQSVERLCLRLEYYIQDLSPVLDCKKLRDIRVNEEQAAYFTEQDEKHSYQIEIK